ncbi:MAG: Slp family lipoprotein [Thermodesulfovibrionales bacterium]
MGIRFVFAFLGLFLLASCAHVISAPNRAGALTGVPFRQIRENPAAYLNSRLILGGKIAETTTTNAGSEIEVVQNPLDRYGYIEETDYSEGRFIVAVAEQLDPEIFEKGRYVTVAGVLAGTRPGRINNADYLFPVIHAQEIRLWKEPVPYPYPYGYYDPFYSPYYMVPYPYGYGPLISGPRFYYRPHHHR